MTYAWVALQVLSGREVDVRHYIDSDMNNNINDHPIAKTFAPVKEIIVPATKNLIFQPVFTGYVFVKCCLTNQLWHYLKHIPHVYGILKGTVTEEEMQRLQSQITNEAEFNIPDNNTLKAMQEKFKELILTKRNNKPVFRLPLEIVRNLVNKAQVLINGIVYEETLIRLLLKPVQLAL